jgi:zinc transport system substrate-binding protein
MKQSRAIRPFFAGLLTAGLLAGMLAACTSASSTGGKVRVVGSLYPLAWVAERIGGNRVDVTDLTPPGVEAHEVSLSARQVADIHGADVVFILGYLGFQPQVEDAARQASGRVVEVATGIDLHPSQERGLAGDPHVWLDPVLMEKIAGAVSDALIAADPQGATEYRQRSTATLTELADLDAAYRSGLAHCRFGEFVTTHEAFGYLASEYGLDQLGIEGLTPEAEPSAAQLRAAEESITSGHAAPAVFYEGTDEGKRVGQSVARSVGVPALPLGTLEFDPVPEDYLAVMRANLGSLKEGMQCG